MVKYANNKHEEMKKARNSDQIDSIVYIAPVVMYGVWCTAVNSIHHHIHTVPIAQYTCICQWHAYKRNPKEYDKNSLTAKRAFTPAINIRFIYFYNEVTFNRQICCSVVAD